MVNYTSLREVATTAGVSFQTASKVLTGKGNVSPATRSRILAAAAALEYVPNALARYLASCRTRTETESPLLGQQTNRAGSRPTMREVAAVAGVSLKSVSRAINGEPGVSESLRSRVQDAVDQLEYRHNMHASSLRRADGKSATIGLLLADADSPFSSTLHRVIQNEALDRGVLVFAGSSDDDVQRERELMAAFTAHRVDGLIIAATPHDHSVLVSERRAGTAVVLVDQAPSVLDVDSVLTDDCEGVRLGIRHLIACGHKRIAYLGGPAPLESVNRRYKGYVEELTAHGLPIDQQLVRLDISDIGAAQTAAVKLLSRLDYPTALITSYNAATIGVHRATQALDLDCQVAIVGFDDVLLADLVGHGITVVTPDPVAVGRAATHILFRRIDGDESPPINWLVPARLITRGTAERLRRM